MNTGFTIEMHGARGKLYYHAPQSIHVPDTHGAPSNDLICHAKQNGLLCVFLGRLFYRTDNRNCPHQAPTDISASAEPLNDAAWILSVYRDGEWIQRDNLEGEYCYVIWDAPRGQMMATRDPMGSYPLYWWSDTNRLCLSSSLNDLRRKIGLNAIDTSFVADFLAPGGLRQEAAGAGCVWKAANRLLPGERICFTIPSYTVQRQRSPEWLSRIVLPDSIQPEDAAVQYRAVLIDAIRERLAGPIVAHVSGGIDSTGIACLARDQLLLLQKDARLTGQSLCYQRLPRLKHERQYIDMAEVALGDRLARIDGDDLLNFDAFAEPPPLDEPYQGLWQLEAEAALASGAVALQAHTILTGIGGDEIHDNCPFQIADLCRQRKFHKAWKLASQVAAAWHVSAWNVLLPFGIQPAWKRFRAERGWWSRRGRPASDLIPAWIRPAFAKRWDLAGRAWENVRSYYGRTESVHLSVAIDGVEHRQGSVARQALAAPQGIHITHPFLDRRVIALGLGIRSAVAIPPGMQKPLLSRVFAGRVPDSILQRPRKANFDELYYHGLRRNTSVLRELITSTAAETADWLDPEGLSKQLELTLLGVPTADQLRTFDSALSLICWLKHRNRSFVFPPPIRIFELVKSQ